MKFRYWLGAATSALIATSAYAQSADVQQPGSGDIVAAQDDGAADIVVTGIRASLRSSAALKRNASQIVDAVSAEDVGKFPDVNIAESLQRVTGVAIDRNGGEGQFITVRGLGPQFNTVLVNGRIMATDNAGREFSFDVLSPNMIQRTEVYKSAVPQLQEGGIGATVNVVTAKPFDGKTGFHVTAAAAGMYDDLRKKVSPDLSGVMSLTNDTKTLGLVVSASYTNRSSQNDQFIIHGWLPGSQGLIDGTPASTGLDGSALTNSPSNIFTPRDSTFNRGLDKRERINVASTFQAQLSDQLLLTVDGIYSKFNVQNVQRSFGPYYTPRFMQLQANGNGTVTSFTRPGTEFLAANPGLTDPALGDQRVTLAQNDNYASTSDRFTNSYQVGANLKWSPNENLDLKFDASMTQAKARNPSTFIVVGSHAQTTSGWELVSGQDIPTVSNLGPITDPSLMRAHYSFYGEGRTRDKGTEFHFDGEYRYDEGFVKSVQFGAAYNQRRKVRTNRDNGDTSCTYCGYEVAIPGSLLTPYTLDNWLTKASGSAQSPKSFFTYDPFAIMEYLSRPDVLAQARQDRTPEEQAAEAARIQALGGPFALIDRPGQKMDVQEKVLAGYVTVGVGGPRWSGNVGFRVAHTKMVSRGFGQTIESISVNPGDDNLLFTYSDPQPLRIDNSYTNFMPSANVKYDLTDRMLLRGAVSQTVTRPTLTDLGTNNNYTGRITAALSSGGNPYLKPFKSTNYDLSYEWYLSDVSYVSLAGFYKEFADFLETQTLPAQIAGYTFQDTRTRNGQKGSVAGIEVGGQYSFDKLPGFFGGFGVSGNYTYVTSTAKRSEDQNNSCGYNGLSPHSANGSLFFQKYGVQTRVSYNWRSSFLRSCFSDYSQPENRKAYGQLDFSASYDLTPNFQIYVQGVNLTENYIWDYSVYEERVKNIQNTGRRFNFGVRANF